MEFSKTWICHYWDRATSPARPTLLFCTSLQPIHCLGKLKVYDNCSNHEQASCLDTTNKYFHEKSPNDINSTDQFSQAGLLSQTCDRILQLDGNATLNDEDIPLESSFSSLSSISVPQTGDQYSSLPTIYSANARSVFPKYDDLVHKLKNSRIDLAQISETWQDINKQEHKKKIDTLEHQHGYKWYSYARAKYRDDGSLTGGGGCAILVNTRNWLSHQLSDIIVPQG